MPVLFAHMNPQSSCATLVRTRGADGSWGFGQGAVEFCGGEVISTAGLLAEPDRALNQRGSSSMKVLLPMGGCGRSQVRRGSEFADRTDYPAGNDSTKCPGGSGHSFD